MKLLIKKMGINGEGIGYINRKPVFINGAFPGELVEVQITEENNHYARAKVKSILKKSPARIDTDYKYYEVERCPLYPMQYQSQLEYKNNY